MSNPLISVIITCNNCKDSIGMTITSVINQYVSNIEIILIDDCSSDNSPEIIKQFIEVDKRIIFLKNPIHSGSLFSRYKGLLVSKGNYVINLNSGEYYSSPFVFDRLLQNIGGYDLMMFKAINKEGENYFLTPKELEMNNYEYSEEKTFVKMRGEKKIDLDVNEMKLSTNFIRRSAYLNSYNLLDKNYLYMNASLDDKIENKSNSN